jgi:uncharacterized protein (TIGR02118 family)
LEVTHFLIALWGDADTRSAAEEWARSARARTISVAVEDQGRFAAGDPVDVLIALEGSVRPRIRVPARGVRVWAVQPFHPIRSTDATDVKMVSFVQRAQHLTREQFAEHWTQQHAPLARRHHIGLADYTQNVVVDADSSVDGIAELRFRTRTDFETRFYDSDAGKAVIREDVQRFIARPSNLAALMRETRLTSEG